MTKTDNESQIGMHVFERAGLGKAPFRVVGFKEVVFTNPDGSTKAGTSCDYCGTGIRNVFMIRGSDGFEFKVGCDCVEKTGDAGLIRGYKNSPEYRNMMKGRRVAKSNAQRIEFKELLYSNEAVLRTQMLNNKWDVFSYLERVYPMCGAAGIARNLKSLKKIIKELENVPNI